MRPAVWVWVLAVLLAASYGIGQESPVGQESSGDYRVGPKDLIEVRVLELPELAVERRVSDSGMIELPLLGEMAVSGLTASEIRGRLEATLKAKYVNRASISIVVKEFANKPVSVLGAVQRPGSLSISGRWTLVNAITAAGGLTASAGHKIYVLRRAENGLSDTLEIPPRTSMTVFCLGEVKNPGAIQFDSDDRLSLLSVIAKAGGLTDRASKTVRIKRRNAEGKDVEKVVDFKRIVSGQDEDYPIEANDVIVVKESFF
jgi:polysaccharide export outer membrane protein